MSCPFCGTDVTDYADIILCPEEIVYKLFHLFLLLDLSRNPTQHPLAQHHTDSSCPSDDYPSELSTHSLSADAA